MRFLQQTPTEINTLFGDLLIGVTSFFRDKAAFKALEEQVITFVNVQDLRLQTETILAE